MSEQARRLAGDVREALERSAPEEALRRVRALQSQSLIDLLEAFETAIEDESYAEAETLLTQIEAKINDRRPDERELVAKARATRESDAVSFQTQRDLTEFIQQMTAVSLHRSSVLLLGGTYVSAPAQSDSTEVVSAVSEATQAESTRQTKQQTAASITTQSDTPPSVAVLVARVSPDPVSVGRDGTLTVTVGNVGDGAAEGVELSVDPPSGLTATKSTIAIGALAADASVEKSVTVSGTKAGDYSLPVKVTSANAGQASETVSVSVRDETSGGGAENPFPNGIPGVGTQPTDPDNDGKYEDINGDGTVTFDDAIALAFADFDTINGDQAQIAALDFDGDGDVDFDDAIELAFQV